MSLISNFPMVEKKDKIKPPPSPLFVRSCFYQINQTPTQSTISTNPTKQPKRNPIFSSFLLQRVERIKKKSRENRGKFDGSDLFGSWGKRRKIEVQRSIIKAEGLWVGVASSVIVLLESLPGFSLSQWLKNPSPFLSFISTCQLF